jgi:hypothetical protein
MTPRWHLRGETLRHRLPLRPHPTALRILASSSCSCQRLLIRGHCHDCRHGGRCIGRSHCFRRRGSCKAVAGRSEAHFFSGTCEARLGEQVEHEQVLSQQVRAAVRPDLGAHETGSCRHGCRRPPRGPLPSTTSRGWWPNRRVAVTTLDDAQ